MRSTKETNCYFGGMASPSWKSSEKGEYITDSNNECSWLFKMMIEGDR